MKPVLVLILVLAFPMTVTANSGDLCRNMNGHGGDSSEPIFDCEFGGDTFDFCFESSLRGTINGSLMEYYNWDWFYYFAPPLKDFGVPAPNYGSYYMREVDLFMSKQGELWGEAQYVIDWYNITLGGVAVPIMITGGTGMYEDAYGWITLTVTDPGLTNFTYDGRVCWPKANDD